MESVSQSAGVMADGKPWPPRHTTTTFQYDSQMRVTIVRDVTKVEESPERTQTTNISYAPNLYTCRYSTSESEGEREERLYLNEQTGRVSKIEYINVSGFVESATDFVFDNEGKLLSFSPGFFYAKQVSLSWSAGNMTQYAVDFRSGDKTLTHKREYTDIKNNIYPNITGLMNELGMNAQLLFNKELGLRSTHLPKAITRDPSEPFSRSFSLSYDYELDELGRPIRITENYKDGTKVIRTITYVEQ